MKICPTCNRPWTVTLRRVCGRCHQPILRHHKYTYQESTIVHRSCDDPLSYPGEEGVVDAAPLLEVEG